MSPSSTDAVSPAQFKEALFAAPLLHVHALLMSARLPDLAERLALAQAQNDIEDHDCLWPGALDAPTREHAPYLVRLRRDSRLTDWLLGDELRQLPNWGMFARSGLGFTAVRSHARSLCRASTVDGQAVMLDWIDPQVMDVLLPLATPEQLDEIFSAFESMMWSDAQGWQRYSLQSNRLQAHRHALL